MILLFHIMQTSSKSTLFLLEDTLHISRHIGPKCTMAPPSFEVAQAMATVKAKYCRFADTQQWESFDQILLPDFEFKMKHGNVVHDFSSRHDWVTHFTELFRPLQTQHLVGPAELDQGSPDEVKAVVPVQYLVASKDQRSKLRMLGAGYLHDTNRRVDSAWFLARSEAKQYVLRTGSLLVLRMLQV